MSTFFDCFSQLFQYLRSLTAIGLLCLVVAWSLPAQAANPIEPQVEQEVLQIIREHPEVIIESVQAYQQQQQQKVSQGRQIFLQDLKTNPQGVIARANASKLLLITTKVKNQRKNQDFAFNYFYFLSPKAIA